MPKKIRIIVIDNNNAIIYINSMRRHKIIRNENLLASENHSVSLPVWLWAACREATIITGATGHNEYFQKAIVTQLKRDKLWKRWQGKVDKYLSDMDVT